MSGLIADSRTLVDKARVDAQNHWFSYNEPMSVESVTQSVSNLAMQFGEEGDDRPMVSDGEEGESVLPLGYGSAKANTFGTVVCWLKSFGI